MPFLIVSPAIFQTFPDAVLGLVIAHGIDNTGGQPEALAEIRAALRGEEALVAERLAGLSVNDHPHIAAWREAYRKFGAKPKDYPSSIENLARRVLKGQALPHINPLVDIYNTISLRYLVPAGGEDLDQIVGDVWLTFAGEHEAPVRLLGEAEERAPKPGEVIYKDDLGAICRRWNWKEADRTKFTEATRHAVLVVEGLPPVDHALLQQALADLAALVTRYCGGTVTTAMLDTSNFNVELH